MKRNMKVRMIYPDKVREEFIVLWEGPCKNGFSHHSARLDVKEYKDDGTPHKITTPWDAYTLEQLPVVCDECGVTREPSQGTKSMGTYTVWTNGSRHPQPGDMWWAPWYHQDGRCLMGWDNCNDPRGHLMCKLPNGHSWDIDSRCSNCTMKDDRTHKCWIRHGEAPDITVDKNGFTCSAGAGSIIGGDWHGFLRNGVLEEC